MRNEYDETKEMLNICRGIFFGKNRMDESMGDISLEDIFKKGEEERQQSDASSQSEEEFNEVDVDNENSTTLSENELEDEQNGFKESVGGVVTFGDFQILKGNIKWSGRLDNERINWVYNLNLNDGCSITTENTSLTDETMERIIKLKNYFNTWKDYWSSEVNG